MKISLVTVTFNAEKFIADCIDSVIRQTYRNVEHIIIDGKSTDATLAILQKYQHHIYKLISKTDLGIYDAMNKGIAISTGDVIGILNSDDFFASDDVLENIAHQFSPDNGNTPDIVYGDLWYVDRKNPQIVLRKWKSQPYHKNLFRWGWMPPHPTFYARKDLFSRFGNYDLRFGSASDYELMLRFMHRYQAKSTYLNKVIVKMRIGGTSNKTLAHRMEANRMDRKAMTLHQVRFSFLAAVLKPLRKIFQYRIFSKSIRI